MWLEVGHEDSQEWNDAQHVPFWPLFLKGNLLSLSSHLP